MRNITLNSGRLDATNGLNTSYRSWALNGTITSTGTSTITDSGGDSGIILASGTPINTDLNVQSGTLDVSGTLHNGRTATGHAARATSITKLGAGTMILSTSGHSYTGATNVNAGTLLIDGSTPSSSAVTVATNATLGGTGTIGHNTSIANGGGLVFQLNTPAASHDKLALAATKTMTFTGASTLTLTSAGAAIPGDYTLVTAPGGFGASVPPATVILPLGWAAAAPRFVGNDLRINITSTTPYLTWAGAAPFHGDANGDGVSNGLAFLLGAASPNANAVGLLPVITKSANGLTLFFSMLNAATAGTSVMNVQHSSDLGVRDPWETETIPAVSGIFGGITFVISTASPTLNTVQATISSTQSEEGRLFSRLQAEQP